MIKVSQLKRFGVFFLFAAPLALSYCKQRDVEVVRTKFTPGRGFCEVEFDVRNHLHVSVVAEVKLEALFLRVGLKGSRTLEYRGQEVVHVEVPAEETIHRIEKLKTTGRVGRVRVKLLGFSQK